MEYYSAERILLSHKKYYSATTWMDLETIMLSEHTYIQSEHTDKDKYCMVSLICEL